MSNLDVPINNPIDHSNIQLTMTTGATIERDVLYVSQVFDKYEEYSDEMEVSRLSFVDLREKEPNWLYHDVDWKVNALCVWQSYPHAKRLYVAMGSEGNIEMIGPGGNPTISEHIDGAGLNADWSRFLGYMNHIAEIGTSLYACGGSNQIYRRTADTAWELISQDILIDPHELHSRDDPMAGIRHLSYIAGLSEGDMYTVGLKGEIHHFDGSTWTKVQTDTTRPLFEIEIIDEDNIYVCGGYSAFLHGNKKDGFRSVWPLEDEVYFTGIAYFLDLIWLASTRRGLYTFDPKNGRAKPYTTDLNPGFLDPHKLEVRDGVMWCFGFKDLAFFDGITWTRVQHPDNPPLK